MEHQLHPVYSTVFQQRNRDFPFHSRKNIKSGLALLSHSQDTLYSLNKYKATSDWLRWRDRQMTSHCMVLSPLLSLTQSRLSYINKTVLLQFTPLPVTQSRVIFFLKKHTAVTEPTRCATGGTRGKVLGGHPPRTEQPHYSAVRNS